MSLSDPAAVNAMIGRQPGAVPVTYGGVTGWGFEGLPPGVALEEPTVVSGKPAVQVAARYFPGIGVDRVNGQQGVNGTAITVNNRVWRIREVAPGTDDGAEVVVMLTHPE